MKSSHLMRTAGLLGLLSALPSCDLDDALFFHCDVPNDGNWVSYGRDPGSNHCVKSESFKDSSNVAQLKTAWDVAGLPGATGTPVVKDGVVYFGDWEGTLHAVEALTGKTVWTSTVAPGAPIRSTPTIAGDTVYAAWSTFVTAYDIKTGAPRWVQPIDEHPYAYIESAPIVVDNHLIIGVASYELTLDLPDYTFRGSVVSLDTQTGQEQWRLYTTTNDALAGAGGSVWSSAAIDPSRKLAFIGTGQSYEAPASPLTDSVLAINYETGALVWKNQYTKDDVYTTVDLGPGQDFDIGATPTLVRTKNRDLVVAGSKAGILKALDRDTGTEAWVVQLNKGSDVGGIMVSAATAQGVIYVNTNNWVDFGFLHGVHSPNDTSTTFAIDAETGATRWRVDLPAPMFGAVTLVNGVLYQGLINGVLVALDADNGKELFRDVLPGPIGAGPSVAEGTLYVSYGFSFFKADGDLPFASGVRAYR